MGIVTGREVPEDQIWVDTFFVSVGGVIMGINALSAGTLVFLRYRYKYSAIKSKSPVLTFIMTLAGILWFFGICLSNHLIGQDGFWKATCRFWWTYGHTVFGALLWLSCINTRLLQLYFIFVLVKKQIHYFINFLKISNFFFLISILFLNVKNFD
eukprot:gb/GECH01010708.1/.p1 GENE.gb/GECH01010708.1/~~gb/GECH01010708.1/.p1  ORF type:complete len:155 (+),score=13.51 gb/GECH01010708.1/:1-465(+)